MRKIITFLFILNISIAIGQQSDSFDRYIANFKVIQSDTISDIDFRSNQPITNEFIFYFVPDDDDCECMIESMWYSYASVIEKGDILIVRDVEGLKKSIVKHALN